MPDAVAEALGWIVPAVIVFAVAALLVAAAVFALRRARRSPRARTAAEGERAGAGAALVALDDAIEEAGLEDGLSGALFGGDAPPTLRRARMTAQHVRVRAFEDYRSVSVEPAPHPDQITRTSRRIRSRVDEARAILDRAAAEHAAWVRGNVSAADQVAAASRRLDDVRRSTGDLQALVDELRSRFDETEWTDAAAAARAALADADAAASHLGRARHATGDPTRTALPDLTEAERALRHAQAEARAVEEKHRLVTQAALAVPGELDVLRTALRQAEALRATLEPDAADRLGAEVRGVDAAATALEPAAARRPTATIDGIARARDRLDRALGDARTAQQRLRGARTALAGTLAAARNAVAGAEGAVAHARAGADARMRLSTAQAELAAARQAQDPVEALDAARRALRAAEFASDLAAYDRRG